MEVAFEQAVRGQVRERLRIFSLARAEIEHPFTLALCVAIYSIILTGMPDNGVNIYRAS